MLLPCALLAAQSVDDLTSATCVAPTGAFNYCIENTGSTTTSMAVAAAITNCSSNTTLAAAYTALTPITDTAAANTGVVPRLIFTVTKAAMGLLQSKKETG